jgi:hypothetical protein
MNIRCDQCGYESDSRYRFCGMCGAKLPLPPSPGSEASVARPEREETNRPLSAPSFLGLSEEPTSSVTYLLEDELSTSHWKRSLVLILFLAVLGIAAWHWRTALRAYVTAKLQEPTNTNQVEVPTEAPISTSASEVAPASPAANAPLDKPATGVGDLPANPPQNSAPPAANPATLPNPSPQSNGLAPAANAAPAANSAPASNAAPDQTTQNQAQTAKEAAPKAEAQISNSTEPQVRKSAPLHNTGDQLEQDGERYLYGTGGVSPDCDRAQKDLLAAAGQGNAKAYSVLGTMYATGHCTSRDLPLSYHWFARALQQEPGNARLQRDLQVLWSQMTDEERQLAMRTGR